MPSFYGHCFVSRVLCRPSLSSGMRYMQITVGLVLNWYLSKNHGGRWCTPTTGDGLDLECGAVTPFVLSFGPQLHFWDVNENLTVRPVT